MTERSGGAVRKESGGGSRTSPKGVKRLRYDIVRAREGRKGAVSVREVDVVVSCLLCGIIFRGAIPKRWFSCCKARQGECKIPARNENSGSL